jgi:hypothetical protein
MDVLPPRPLRLRATFVVHCGALASVLVATGSGLAWWGLVVRAQAIFGRGQWLHGLLLAGVGALLIWVGLLSLRALVDARRCARDSDELALELVSITEASKGERPSRGRMFRYRTATGIEGQVYFTGDHGPLYSDGTHRFLVALCPREAATRLLVVRDDFYPFEFSDDEARAIRRRTDGGDAA